jgi:hypothetical protein
MIEVNYCFKYVRFNVTFSSKNEETQTSVVYFFMLKIKSVVQMYSHCLESEIVCPVISVIMAVSKNVSNKSSCFQRAVHYIVMGRGDACDENNCGLWI